MLTIRKNAEPNLYRNDNDREVTIFSAYNGENNNQTSSKFTHNKDHDDSALLIKKSKGKSRVQTSMTAQPGPRKSQNFICD